MILGRQVTIDTKNELQDVFIDSDTFFNFVPDINGNYFLITSEQDNEEILNSQYAYLLDIPLTEYIPPLPPTPPIN